MQGFCPRLESERSLTIEVMTAEEVVVGGGRFGRHVALYLLADGQWPGGFDVPPKLSARVRVFSTGQGRKTDATDAHSVALVGLGWPGCVRWSMTSS